jgi:tetratricopeptide (TPR) repeat protein
MSSPDATPNASPAAGLSLASAHFAQGRSADALEACARILKDHPGFAPALHLAGVVRSHGGDLGGALELVRRAAAAAPDEAVYQANLCELARRSGRLDEALAAGRRAIALDPGAHAAHNNLGIVHYERGEYSLAANAYRAALAAKPDFALAQSNLGNALAALDRIDAAVEAYRTALALDPNFVDAWCNLGSVLNIAGRRDEALEAYRTGVARDPLSADAHTGVALQQLLRGDLDAGWFEYEWRMRSSEVRRATFEGPAWQGDAPRGRRLLLHAEQGLGDTLQFCRYASLLRERGAEVVLRVQAPLRRLMAQSFPEATVLADTETPLPCHGQCALMSLPMLLGGEMPGGVPYLRAAPGEVVTWRERLAAPRAKLRVGLAWSGNPRHRNDRNRSIALKVLSPLLDIRGVQWVSLQVGRGERPEALPPQLLDASPWIGDFADTAAALEALDLVVCVDTAVAHLAGGLGRPTWLLLPVGSDWRWGLERADSPWYPSVTLFRQETYGDWSSVVSRLRRELVRRAGRGR